MKPPPTQESLVSEKEKNKDTSDRSEEMAMDKELEEVHEVVIVGAGIAGLATAVGLQRMGVASLVLERAPKLRTTGSSITLAPNAWRALEALGVAHKLFAVYKPFQKILFTNIEDGVTQEVSVGRGAMAVHRKFLQQVLADELPPDTIRFSSKIISIQTGEGDLARSPSQATVLLLDDGTSLKAKVLIGCDGVHSAVARWLGLAAPIESGRSAIRGLSVYPEGHGIKNEVHQFLGYGMRALILPLNQNDVFWSVVHFSVPNEKEISRNHPELILKEVTENLCKDFPAEYLDVVRRSDLSSVTWWPLLFRAPWDVAFGRMRKGCVTVAGDAMHPMTPDLGQGGCIALEDAVVLARNIGRARGWTTARIEKGMESYVKERRRRVAEIIAMAYLYGWAQQGGSNGGIGKWMKEWFRDKILFRFVFKHIRGIAEYDCGDLDPDGDGE